jgi:hypothetical protein
VTILRLLYTLDDTPHVKAPAKHFFERQLSECW